jgi:hypothetical protein
MWSDNDIDEAFQRLNPPEPEPTPFPLDAWLRLETGLDKAVIERAVRRRLWKFFAAEVAVVILAALAWLAWPTTAPSTSTATAKTAAPSPTTSISSVTNRTDAHTSRSRRATPAAGTAGAAVGATAGPSFPATTATAPRAETAAVAKAPVSPAPAMTAAPVSHPASAATTTAKTWPFAAATVLAGRTRRQPPGARAQSLESANKLTSRDYARPTASIRQQAASGRMPGVSQAVGVGSTTVRGPIRHSTAGSIAASPGAPTEAAAVAAAASPRRYGEGQPPLPTRPADVRTTAASTSFDESQASAGTTEGSAAATALATLAPIASTLRLPDAASLPTPLATVAIAPANLPKAVRQPRFYIGLVAAPDVSTVRFASVERPLPNLGLLLEYRLTNRLRVTTGLLRSKKQYIARREDYDFGAFTSRVLQRDFTDVEGTCIVLDVPLDLRYDFVAKPEYRVFGNLGLSSYFMQRENYSYEYQENNAPKYWNGEFENQNRHLLSVLNVSAGYEHSLGRHWSAQAEPYLKVPLAGVGQGKVRLTSAGVFFGLKYGF